MICAAADLHGELLEIAPCELLILAGDLAPYAIESDPPRCREWFATEFAEWLDASPASEVIGVAGNHDFWAPEIGRGVHDRLFGARWTYLCDAETSTESGLRIYGSPWTPNVYDTAFEASASELTRRWAAIPSGLDVLVVHCPPLGHGDHIGAAEGAPDLMGAPELLTAIRRARPKLVVYGHAHEGFGYRGEDPPGTTLANVTIRTDYAGGLHEVSEFTTAGLLHS